MKPWSPDFALRRIHSAAAVDAVYFQVTFLTNMSMSHPCLHRSTVLEYSTSCASHRISDTFWFSVKIVARPASHSRDSWLYNLNNHRCNFDHFAIRCLTITYLCLHTGKDHRLAVETTIKHQ